MDESIAAKVNPNLTITNYSYANVNVTWKYLSVWSHVILFNFDSHLMQKATHGEIFPAKDLTNVPFKTSSWKLAFIKVTLLCVFREKLVIVLSRLELTHTATLSKHAAARLLMFGASCHSTLSCANVWSLRQYEPVNGLCCLHLIQLNIKVL